MGMSFYTLQMLSYVLDVYRGEVKAQKNPADLALYVAMFPKMPGGPVVRYSEMEKQLKARQMSLVKIGEGAMFFIRGLFKKVIFADNIGLVHAQIMSLEAGQVSVLSAWLGCAAFALKIYYNLSGYTDMAVGLGKMTGFDFPGNFDYPYLAGSTTEFWYKWHMSLGSWFREYVYHPLGGGDVEETKQVRNILLIWLLAGLLHGMSGGYMGTVLRTPDGGGETVPVENAGPAARSSRSYLQYHPGNDRMGVLFSTRTFKGVCLCGKYVRSGRKCTGG